jgi:antirestriction protein ArdC
MENQTPSPVTQPKELQFNLGQFEGFNFRTQSAIDHGLSAEEVPATEGERLPPFSFEALVAELGAAFLCGFAGLRNVTADALPASSSQGWAEALRADPGLLVRR